MFSKEKYCVLPGQAPIRLAGGIHVVVVDETPTVLPIEFEREALGKGACTEARMNELRAALLGSGQQNLLEPSAEEKKKAEEIQKAIVEMIAGAAKPEDFDKAGKPTVEALKVKLGYAVTAAERDAALAVIKGQ